ncbi:MAG: iron-sulfur cluster insertion protein ErpA [Anaerolineae bacterium]|nr:iron-sulfur cluster insertion protein ErpA [Anaerolineae bacterium]
MSIIEQDNIQTTVIDTSPTLTVTPSAVMVIRNLLEQRNIPNHSLRVFVSGGGCSGLQYGMAFEESPREFDQVVRVDGVSLIVDQTSLMYLQGATIDYIDSLMGGGFRIDNPNAVSSCGCGHSFRTAQGGEAESSSGGCGSCSH